jgi:hypothetical protein
VKEVEIPAASFAKKSPPTASREPLAAWTQWGLEHGPASQDLAGAGIERARLVQKPADLECDPARVEAVVVQCDGGYGAVGIADGRRSVNEFNTAKLVRDSPATDESSATVKRQAGRMSVDRTVGAGFQPWRAGAGVDGRRLAGWPPAW